MTMVSMRGELAAQAEVNETHYEVLIEEVSILDATTWPLNYAKNSNLVSTTSEVYVDYSEY